jgi:hypothetical protein
VTDLNSELRWIESGGGPLILLPARLARDWSGTLPPPHEPISGDYARAVAVAEYVGSIPVGEGAGLVLGGDPLPATVLRVGPGLVIARWLYANSDEAALAALRNPDKLSYKPESFLFENSDETVVLMDAACSFEAANDCLTMQLEAGTYGIATAEYKPDKDTFFVIHRLERL